MKQSLFTVGRVLYSSIFLLAALLAVFLLTSNRANASDDPFITTWKTNAMYSSGDTLRLKIHPDYHGLVDFNVDWGDGTTSIGVSNNPTHEYSTPGTYTVQITGDFPGFYFEAHNNTTQLLLSIDSWGSVQWRTAQFAFKDAQRMVINATDTPDLSQVTSMESMFEGNYFFNHPINDWDVSNVENFESVFENNYSFNQPLDQWDTSSATNLRRMFYGAREFNQDISTWNISNVWRAESIFEGASEFNQNLGQWDISSVSTLQDALNNSGMSWKNYDQTIESWSSQDLEENVLLGAEGLHYCGANQARDELTGAFNWQISGDSRLSDECAPKEILFAESGVNSTDIEEDQTAEGIVVGTLTVSDDDFGWDWYEFDFECLQSTGDELYFSLSDGVLSLITALDYETPEDVNADNTYEFCVRVEDRSGNQLEHTVAVVVRDSVEQNTGQVLSAVDVSDEGQDDDNLDDEAGEVLAESTQGEVLADTGAPAIVSFAVAIVILVIAAGISLDRKKVYSLHRY